MKKKFSSKLWPVIGWVAWIVTAFFLASIVVALGLAVLLYTGITDGNWYDNTAAVTVVNAIVYVMILLIALWPLWVRQNRSAARARDSEEILRALETATGGEKNQSKKLDKKAKQTERRNKWKDMAVLVGLSRWPSWGDLGKLLSYVPVFYVVLIVASTVLAVILGSLVGSETATEILNQEQDVGFTVEEARATAAWVWQIVLIGLSLVLVAPLAEEMLMRGLLFGRLRRYLSFWPTAIIVSLLFALAHGQWNAGVMTFILSMFACNLREKTGAIWAGIGLHMVVNAVAFSLRFIFGAG